MFWNCSKIDRKYIIKMMNGNVYIKKIKKIFWCFSLNKLYHERCSSLSDINPVRFVN